MIDTGSNDYGPKRQAWAFSSEFIETSSGAGNWEAFHASPFTIHDVLAAAGSWATQLEKREKLWLCWNVDPAWCLVQQALVLSVGWTPLVGYDPRCGPAPLLPGAIGMDFYGPFGFRTMWPHFVLDYAHVFAKKLAFWHSDLLLRKQQLADYARRFELLLPGQVIATQESRSLKSLLMGKKPRRAWELLGCVTREASQDLFEKGCGWWMSFYLHPMHSGHHERLRRTKEYWDHGTGVLYWANHAGGHLELIPERDIREGHFTRIGREERYKVFGGSDWRRDLTKDLAGNFSLEKACEQFDLSAEFEMARPYIQKLHEPCQ